MPDLFSDKLGLVLKALSITRGRLAADLGVDKSVVGRWATGTVKPSAHNLSLITALVARRVPGFTILDWDRGLHSLALLLGADPEAIPGLEPPSIPTGLPIALLDQVHAMTTLRAKAYEGLFRSTRPFILQPGKFLHDHGIIQLDAETGLLRLRMGTAGTVVDGWVLLLNNQLFIIAADVTSGSMLFGIFNGVATAKADVFDGICLGAALDAARTPTATGMLVERIADLSDDPEADEQKFMELARSNPIAPEGSIPEYIQAHLVRDIGPEQMARGGELLLQMPLARTMARGPAYGQ